MIDKKRWEPTEFLDSVVRQIIGAAIQVHRILGPGFMERIYEEALCLELCELKIRFRRQVPVQVKYRSHLIGLSRLDLVVENEIVVELKAVEVVCSLHAAQLISYLKATNFHLGLLINFNVPTLKQGIRRFIVS